jgi:hypothetical protein
MAQQVVSFTWKSYKYMLLQLVKLSSLGQDSIFMIQLLLFTGTLVISFSPGFPDLMLKNSKDFDVENKFVF